MGTISVQGGINENIVEIHGLHLRKLGELNVSNFRLSCEWHQ